jgi:hypothetical protein
MVLADCPVGGTTEQSDAVAPPHVEHRG